MNGLKTSLKVGLQILKQLALADGEPVTVRFLAETLQQSDKYLEQLLLPLRRARIVRSIRGAHGGYALARPAKQIRLHEIVAVLQGAFVFCDCGNQKCHECVNPEFWQALESCIDEALASVTLADVIHPTVKPRRLTPTVVEGPWVQGGLGI
jgi:Rrf2 family cysteine metabolism transcriptional repressor